jgi:hypothetical protein
MFFKKFWQLVEKGIFTKGVVEWQNMAEVLTVR